MTRQGKFDPDDGYGIIVVYCHPSAKGQNVRIFADYISDHLIHTEYDRDKNMCRDPQFRPVQRETLMGRDRFFATFANVEYGDWIVFPPHISRFVQGAQKAIVTVFAGETHTVDFENIPYS